MNDRFGVIKLIAAILGSFGVVVTTAQNFVNLNQMLEKNFWIVLVCAWLLSLIALWPKPAPHTIGFPVVPRQSDKNSLLNNRYRWAILITLLFCLVGGYRFYEIYLRRTTTPVIVQPVPAHSSRLFVKAVAKPEPNIKIEQSNRIRLRQFELGPATSFIQTKDHFGGFGPTYKTFEMEPFHTKKCEEQIAYIVAPLKEALQRFADKHNKGYLATYIQSDDQVRELAMNRPDIAVQLIPKQPEEWSELSDADYAAYTKWLSSCIGIRVPSFYVTFENLTNEEQLISKVIYRTSKIEQVMGGGEGLLTPNVTYMHTIDWIVGDQGVSLVPPFRIPPKSTAIFELQLSTKFPDWGLCWLMKIFFITEEKQNRLEGVSTDEFQLIMSGKPVPGQIE